MTTPIVIVGCGGFGREVHDVIEAMNAERTTYELLGYVDDAPSEENLKLVTARGSGLLGDTRWLSAQSDVSYVIGIGTGSIRRTLDAQMSTAGLEPQTLVHPTASFGHDVQLGAGTIVCAGARLTTHVSLGRHVHINLNSTIGHDCVLDDYVTVNPLAAVSGGVLVGEAAMLGTNSAILQGLAIGAEAIVGGGACVVRDVEGHTTVKGIPAR